MHLTRRAFRIPSGQTIVREEIVAQLPRHLRGRRLRRAPQQQPSSAGFQSKGCAEGSFEAGGDDKL